MRAAETPVRKTDLLPATAPIPSRSHRPYWADRSVKGGLLMAVTDKLFAGSIPEVYDRYLVPLIFDSYARDLAQRLGAVRPRDVLETAAGTGALTRAIGTPLAAGGGTVGAGAN